MWYIKQETTWRPTGTHPNYWIDKFYPAVPITSFDKNMKNRFISEDQVNCPNREWYICKVIDSKTNWPVP